jgi:hypothetical protein
MPFGQLLHWPRRERQLHGLHGPTAGCKEITWENLLRVKETCLSLYFSVYLCPYAKQVILHMEIWWLPWKYGMMQLRLQVKLS